MSKQKLHENVIQKIVTLLSFSQFSISNYLESTEVTTIKQHSKTKQCFQLINTQTLTKQETLYAIRASDILVIIIDNNYDAELYFEIRKFIPHFIICYTNKNEIKNVKKFAKDVFSHDKVVYIDNLMDQLMLKSGTTRICESRPYFVPSKIQYNNNYIEMEGIARKGFLSRRLIMNGVDYAEIERITINGVEYDGSYIDENNRIMTELNKKYAHEEDKSDEVVDECEEVSFESEVSAESEPCQPSAITEYKNYKGINNLGTCEFVTEEYPDYYNNLHFFERFVEIQKIIGNLQSKMPDNTFVKIVAKLKTQISYRHIVCFNVFDIEGLNTIYNIDFCTDINVVENERITLDLGHRLLAINPMITNILKYKVHVRQSEGTKGCLSFIAPITLNFTKCLIYKNNAYIGSACNNTFYDRILLDEVKLKGFPRKVDKRYCTISDMFNSKAEVLFYRNLSLYTKNGNKGIIKKPIGTHGIFKCYFNRPVNHSTPVYLSLYKRVFLQDYRE